MTEKRYFKEDFYNEYAIKKEDIIIAVVDSGSNARRICDELNALHEENMNLRAKHTQMIIILKDVVNDLKRMDTYRYAEHLEKIANLHFLSEKELKE